MCAGLLLPCVLWLHPATNSPCGAAIVGDITPYCGVTDEDKHQQEREAVQQMKGMLGGCLAGDEIEQLWEEYEAAQTEEAKLVKDFDKVGGCHGNGLRAMSIPVVQSCSPARV